MSRRYLIIVSVAGHLAIALGLFISGIWKIERLDYNHRLTLTLGAMMPLGDGGGGEGDDAQKEKKKQPKKKEKKHEKTVVKEPRQVEKLDRDKPVEDADSTGGGGGGGIGDTEGPTVGPEIGGGGGGGCDPLTDPNKCVVKHTATCGDKIVEGSEQCDDGNVVDGDRCSSTCRIEQVLIPPKMFGGLRISGDTQIAPPDPVKTQIMREGKDRVTGSFKLCIDTAGRISSIAPLGSATGYAAYDTKITTTMRSWQYRPYMLDNKTAVPACSVVTFVYTIK
jgi:cysteine-rich repeat protein